MRFDPLRIFERQSWKSFRTSFSLFITKCYSRFGVGIQLLMTDATVSVSLISFWKDSESLNRTRRFKSFRQQTLLQLHRRASSYQADPKCSRFGFCVINAFTVAIARTDNP